MIKIENIYQEKDLRRRSVETFVKKRFWNILACDRDNRGETALLRIFQSGTSFYSSDSSAGIDPSSPVAVLLNVSREVAKLHPTRDHH